MKVHFYSPIAEEARVLLHHPAFQSTKPIAPEMHPELERRMKAYEAWMSDHNPDRLAPPTPWRIWNVVGYRFQWLPEAERPCLIHLVLGFSTECWWYRRGCLLDGRDDETFQVWADETTPWIAKDMVERVLL